MCNNLAGNATPDHFELSGCTCHPAFSSWSMEHCRKLSIMTWHNYVSDLPAQLWFTWACIPQDVQVFCSFMVPTYSKAFSLPPPNSSTAVLPRFACRILASGERLTAEMPQFKHPACTEADEVPNWTPTTSTYVHYTSSKHRPKKDPTGFKSSTLLISTTLVRRQLWAMNA